MANPMQFNGMEANYEFGMATTTWSTPTNNRSPLPWEASEAVASCDYSCGLYSCGLSCVCNRCKDPRMGRQAGRRGISGLSQNRRLYQTGSKQRAQSSAYGGRFTLSSNSCDSIKALAAWCWGPSALALCLMVLLETGLGPERYAGDAAHLVDAWLAQLMHS